VIIIQEHALISLGFTEKILTERIRPTIGVYGGSSQMMMM
jgi:hypothetical protein